jgi:CheY-like chemotaxis protein
MMRTSSQRPLRVLVVDDFPDTADTLAELLAVWGHDSRIAQDGPSALELARSYRPQVLLLDIGLPGFDGCEVARRLRKEEWVRNSLLVSVSGLGKEEDRRRALEAGFDACLLKPVEPEEIQEILEEYSSRKAEG